MGEEIREQAVEHSKQLIAKSKELIEQSRAIRHAFQIVKQRSETNGFVPSRADSGVLNPSPDQEN